MSFVYYERNVLGRWSIRASDTRPDAKGAEGKRYKLAGIQEIQPEHKGLSLAQLEPLYPLHQGD